MTIHGDKLTPFHFDRHTPDYLDHFEEITKELQTKCPIAWTDTYGGHWVTSGYKEVFEIARNPPLLSSDWDPRGERKGIKALDPCHPGSRSSAATPFMMMDPPRSAGLPKDPQPLPLSCRG